MATNYTDPVPAGLLKRLAEAADSFRDDLVHYFICKTIFPYDLHNTQGYSSDADADCAADSLLNTLGQGYYKFGPYKTDTEGEPAILYDSIQVRYMQGNNELYNETLSSDTDAIILSVSAYDKFFQPYYVRLYGLEEATELRKQALAGLKSLQRASSTHKGLDSVTSTGGTRFAVASYQLG